MCCAFAFLNLFEPVLKCVYQRVCVCKAHQSLYLLCSEEIACKDNNDVLQLSFVMELISHFHTHPTLCFILLTFFYESSNFLSSSVCAGGRGVVVGPIVSQTLSDVFCDNEYGPNFLFRNNGDGTFTDVAQQAGERHISG